MESKLIEYAYPTSATATKQGYGKIGCWFVSLYKDENSIQKIKTLKYFVNKEDAETFAQSLPNPYNFMHKYHN